ncbi:Glutathione peroxidase-like 2 [Homarus americanus]|uniref:Glutathione peroxidase n=2 Tax=Homarus americanus TaxID=6706 RepID=A0A8J5N971_HOMAM|nr:Glutathione peroxidase-like 2 [Homarus americanus]
MNALAEYYADADFEILAFPSNQFELQEPGVTGEEIMNGIRHVRPGGGFEPLFTIFQKTGVNGAKENGLYTFLKGACDYTFTEFWPGLFYDPIKVGDLQWNFEKILIGKDGKPYTRYHPSVILANSFKDDIDYLLNM